MNLHCMDIAGAISLLRSNDRSISWHPIHSFGMYHYDKWGQHSLHGQLCVSIIGVDFWCLRLFYENFISLVIDFRLIETVFYIFREMIVTNHLALFVTLLFLCCIHQGTLNIAPISPNLYVFISIMYYTFYYFSSSCRKRSRWAICVIFLYVTRFPLPINFRVDFLLYAYTRTMLTSTLPQ